ncbi:MAG: adenylate/guanylate cyclase domain-containing protein, partial [Pseudomonadota bacterium]
MHHSRIDPAPRNYAKMVRIAERRQNGPSAAPDVVDVEALERWLIRDAPRIGEVIELIERFFWGCVKVGFPLDRASIHVGTLHPQLAGYAWNWMASDQILDNVIVAIGARSEDAFKRNPLALVFENGQRVRCDPQDSETAARFPLMAELGAQGLTDYIARPVGAAGVFHNAATIGTFRPGGFSEVEVVGLERLFDLFALHIERHIAEMIAQNVARAYLGRSAGEKVLAGAIARGAGERVRAVIWASDLRSFTDRTDSMPAEDVTAMLNAYFGAMTE